eukprot:166135_1
MSTVYLRLFALFLVLIVTNSRQQSQTRYWRGGNDEGTWNVPMNGGVVKTEEWDDGQPQTLSFSMKVPDAIFNQWGHKKTYPYTYHAFVATGQKRMEMISAHCTQGQIKIVDNMLVQAVSKAIQNL